MNTEKKEVSVVFRFDDAQSASVKICGHQIDSIFTTGFIKTQTFKTTMDRKRLRWSGQSMCFIDGEQVDMIFAESDGEFFETREDVVEMFCFKIKRYGHYLELIQDRSQYLSCTNVTTTSEAIDLNYFILTHLVRFGVIDKLKVKVKV